MYSLECLSCGKMFESAKDYTKRCPECRKPGISVVKKPARITGQKVHSLKMDSTKEKVCLGCGKTFTSKRRWLLYPDYCSNKCRKQVSKIQLKSE